MRALYLDCFAGISGDMTVGALLDLGVDVEEMKRQLATLGLSGYEVSVERVKRGGFAATKFTVLVDEARQPHRHLSDIVALIAGSKLSDASKARSIQVFARLAEAEAKVHGATKESVHFHEVGAVDSILDIVGAVVGLELLGVETIYSSPLRVGHGTIKVAHGLLSIPAPGTAELLRGVPVYAGEMEGEFVTPTGAALVAALGESYGVMPPMRIERIGSGAGSRDPKGFSNTLRMTLGEVLEETRRPAETVLVVETNIDDMNPQAYGHLMARAFELGALDVYFTPVQMKKNRPGVMVTLLCEAPAFEPLVDLLLTETTTLGVRYYEANRRVLRRSIEDVDTGYGRMRVKVAREGDRVLHFQPEYEDVARVAVERGVPFLEAQTAAKAAYQEKLKRENDKRKEE